MDIDTLRELYEKGDIAEYERDYDTICGMTENLLEDAVAAKLNGGAVMTGILTTMFIQVLGNSGDSTVSMALISSCLSNASAEIEKDYGSWLNEQKEIH